MHEVTTHHIKPIRSEKDYENALEQLETVFDAEEGTEEADFRDVLAVLIEKYEDTHYPIELPDSVAAIKFRMEQEGLTQKDLVPMIGSKSKVSEVLSGKRRLSLRMIRELHKKLGIPAEVLLQDSRAQSLDPVKGIDVSRFPVEALARLGAFRELRVADAREQAEECIRFLIKRIGGESAVPQGLFRKSESPRLAKNTNRAALQAWSLYVLALAAERKDVTSYEDAARKQGVLEGLVQLSVLDDGPSLAEEFLAKHGIALITAPHFKNTYLDGASFITREGKPVIGLTLRHDRVDNFWFTLLHELGHVGQHLKPGEFVADDMALRGAEDDTDVEREADRFAEEALLPRDFDVDAYVNSPAPEIRRYALVHNRHPAIIAGHIQYRTNNYRRYSGLVGGGKVRRLFFGESS